MLYKSDNISGFTLVELMITVSIAAILMAMAIPSFNATIRSNRLTTYTNELITSFNLARSEAIKRGQQVVVRKTGAEWENGWQVFVDISRVGANANNFDDNGVAPLCEATEDCLLRTYPAIQATYTLRGNNFSNFIRFTSSGQSNTNGSFVICDNSDSNGVPEADTSRLIIVNSVGRVRMGLDANGDGIPNTNTTASAASNITSCTPTFAGS